MRKKVYAFLTMAGLLLGLSMTGFAQEGRVRTPRITHRQKNQQQRIGQGVRSGELTARETIRLEREQHGIQLEKREAREDGNLTRAERRDIYHEQNQASRHIWRAKHNNRDRNYRLPR
jgi:hypothetical protein